VCAQEKYIFGPVPSRRLGLSLGVDIVPFKVCSLDCIYCQLGRTTDKSLERRDYVPIEPVLKGLTDRIARGVRPDFITLSGSGEPTLNSRLGEFLEQIKLVTDIPVAVLTNGTLLFRQDVRADCSRADVVLPSLDAADEETFQRINRPHNRISVEKLIDGLCRFREEFAGGLWLEVFFVEGVNTATNQIAAIGDAIKRIRPDKVQLNTAVRPTAEADVRRLDPQQLKAIVTQLGVKCEIIADFSLERQDKHTIGKAADVLSMLKRRPCTINDLCSGLGISQNEALKYVTHFQNRGVIDSQRQDGTIFFTAK